MCENGVEADGHEPLIRRGGVYFVKAQTVNACVRCDGCTEENWCVQADGFSEEN